jgi:hypothetical protein
MLLIKNCWDKSMSLVLISARMDLAWKWNELDDISHFQYHIIKIEKEEAVDDDTLSDTTQWRLPAVGICMSRA